MTGNKPLERVQGFVTGTKAEHDGGKGEFEEHVVVTVHVWGTPDHEGPDPELRVQVTPKAAKKLVAGSIVEVCIKPWKD